MSVAEIVMVVGLGTLLLLSIIGTVVSANASDRGTQSITGRTLGACSCVGVVMFFVGVFSGEGSLGHLGPWVALFLFVALLGSSGLGLAALMLSLSRRSTRALRIKNVLGH